MIAADKGTLEHALRPLALGPQDMQQRHPAIVPLVQRILGVIPRVFGYLEIWPPAFETYALVVPAFFDIPFCDAGLGVGPATRSLTAYSASRGHGCSYCAAHSAALGSVFRGAGQHLEQNGRAIEQGACALPAPRERAIVEYGMAVARVPSSLESSHMQALHAHFSPKQVDKVILVATTMGLLNRCLDTLGMVLEGPLLQMASQRLASTGWQLERTYDERFDAELIAADDAFAPAPPGLLSLAPKLVGAIRFEARALREIPSGGSLTALLERELGFLPAYVDHFADQRVRRTLAHLLLQRVLGGPGNLEPGLKVAMGVVTARACDNPRLASHFAFLGTRVATHEGLRQLLSSAGQDSAQGLALEFAHRAGQVPHTLDPQLLSRLLSTFEPAELIELVLLVSIYTALHRLVLSLGERPLEGPVADFVRDHGAGLGL